MDSTGAPEFKTKYTVYRLGNNKGFRVVGEVAQDLDLFRMPVRSKSTPTAKLKRNASKSSVPTLRSHRDLRQAAAHRGRSRQPRAQELQRSPVRASITRGQALIQQNDLAGALAEFNKALDANKNSSLAHYRVAKFSSCSATIKPPPTPTANA